MSSKIDLTDEQKAELQRRFFYLKPSGAGVFRHQGLSESFLVTAEKVMTTCPDGREKSLALTKLEEAKFWASAAVARNPDTQ